MRRLRARLRSTWRAMWRANRLDAAMHEEMRFHIDMETERLVRERGLNCREARRQAHVAFGGLEKYKEAGRDTRGLRWLDTLSLDVRLGVRMLVKYRGLTLVGGFAMAVAIAIGVTFFEAFSEVLDPALPLADGARVVALHEATPTPGGAERRVLHDFVASQQNLRSVQQLGAFRTVQHALVADQAAPEIVKAAEMTASGFALARIPPLLGRHLLPGDEYDAAPPVVVIGYDAWRTRFQSDPHVVGRSVRLGGTTATVVGVMPAGFRFPLNHQYWLPLRANPLRYQRLEGPELYVFGRLAPGVTLHEAQAELTVLGQRAAAAHPETHQRLRPVVLPYTHEHVDITNPFRLWALRIAQLFVGALAFVVAVNLAILVYARTVTRLGEIAVRTALGASRRRILGQLFIEALALALVAAAAGLMLADLALARMQVFAEGNGGVPFWVDLKLSLGTVAYAIALAGLGALIMGVLPGLKATSAGVSANLRQLDGRTAGRLGPLWTALIVAQVAVAVAVLPTAVSLASRVVRMGVAGPEFAAEQFIVATVAMGDEESARDAGRIRARQLELTSRLEAELGVSAVTFSSGVPGFAPGRVLEFAGGAGVKYAGARLGVDAFDVGLGLFDVYRAEILAGRGLTAADLTASHVVVNRTFVRQFLDPGFALGARFRYVAPYERRNTRADTWYQVVGVVRDFPDFPPPPGSDGNPTVYHPAAPGDVHPLVLSARFDGNIPTGFLDRVRAIGAEVDPALQLRRVVPLSELYSQMRSVWRYLAWGVGLVTISVLLLSAAGIYALMSFTVAQRAREIAICAALGAAPHRLVIGIFRRVAGQLALGLIVGALLSGAVFLNTDSSIGRAATLTLLVAALMVVVGLLAALGPARRGLRIQPSEVLKADA